MRKLLTAVKNIAHLRKVDRAPPKGWSFMKKNLPLPTQGIPNSVGNTEAYLGILQASKTDLFATIVGGF